MSNNPEMASVGFYTIHLFQSFQVFQCKKKRKFVASKDKMLRKYLLLVDVKEKQNEAED